MKNYYFILGLSIYASDAQIKQAYRRLALQFHPDKNPSAEAETIFKEINEAYEILGNQPSKAAYDELLKGVPSSSDAAIRPHRDPRYHPRPPGSYSRKSKRQEMLETMRQYLKHAMMVSRLTLLFSVVIITDYTLPYVAQEQEVVHTINRREWRGGRSLQLQLDDGEAIHLNRNAAAEFAEGTRLIIQKSSLFGVPVSVENQRTHFVAEIPVSVYGNFMFCPIIMLITSLLGTFYWKGIEFRFNLGVVNFFLAMLTVIFLRIHTFGI
jgi:curved DNA-binding protein CbpA